VHTGEFGVELVRSGFPVGGDQMGVAIGGLDFENALTNLKN